MTAAAFQPLSAVPRDAVTHYLERQGHRPDLIAWKYFDQRFNRDRERGHVWLQGGTVHGFVGRIPFRMQTPGGPIDTAWTCDWSVENPQRNPGIGIMLLRRALSALPVTMSIGGNQLTRSMMPRIATQTIDDAGVVYVRPLRLQYVLEKVDRRVSARRLPVPALAPTWLGAMAWPRAVPSPARQLPVADGVSAELEPVLRAQAAAHPQPLHDFEYVHWQIGRCPALSSWTCVAPPGEQSAAAAVVFRPESRPAHWRMVCWFDERSGQNATDVVRTALRFAADHGAASLSVLTSRDDTHAREVFERHGFARERGGQPLYVSAADAASAPRFDTVRGISYLDADLAYIL